MGYDQHAELLWRVRQGGAGRADEPAAVSVACLLAVAGLVLGILVFLLWVKLLTLTPGGSRGRCDARAGRA